MRTAIGVWRFLAAGDALFVIHEGLHIPLEVP